MKELIKLALGFFCVTLHTACYMRASITKINPEGAGSTLQTSNAKLEFVSTSKPYVYTPSGYSARQSVGSLTAKQMQTTPSGYVVYQFTQGQISADEQ